MASTDLAPLFPAAGRCTSCPMAPKRAVSPRWRRPPAHGVAGLRRDVVRAIRRFNRGRRVAGNPGLDTSTCTAHVTTQGGATGRPPSCATFWLPFAEQVTWHGAIPRAAVPEAIDGADVIIVPNRPGPVSRAVVHEALRQCGKGASGGGVRGRLAQWGRRRPAPMSPSKLTHGSMGSARPRTRPPKLAATRIDWARSNTWEIAGRNGLGTSSGPSRIADPGADGARRRPSSCSPMRCRPTSSGASSATCENLSAALVGKGFP